MRIPECEAFHFCFGSLATIPTPLPAETRRTFADLGHGPVSIIISIVVRPKFAAFLVFGHVWPKFERTVSASFRLEFTQLRAISTGPKLGKHRHAFEELARQWFQNSTRAMQRTALCCAAQIALRALRMLVVPRWWRTVEALNPWMRCAKLVPAGIGTDGIAHGGALYW